VDEGIYALGLQKGDNHSFAKNISLFSQKSDCHPMSAIKFIAQSS